MKANELLSITIQSYIISAVNFFFFLAKTENAEPQIIWTKVKCENGIVVDVDQTKMP